MCRTKSDRRVILPPVALINYFSIRPLRQGLPSLFNTAFFGTCNKNFPNQSFGHLLLFSARGLALTQYLMLVVRTDTAYSTSPFSSAAILVPCRFSPTVTTHIEFPTLFTVTYLTTLRSLLYEKPADRGHGALR